MKKLTPLIAAAVFALSTVSLNALAAEDSTGGPCQADAARLCPGVQKGGGRIKACLKQHKSEVSAECKAKAKEKKAARKAGGNGA